MKSKWLLGWAIACLSLAVVTPVSAQRADRAIITGVVMDPTDYSGMG